MQLRPTLLLQSVTWCAKKTRTAIARAGLQGLQGLHLAWQRPSQCLAPGFKAVSGSELCGAAFASVSMSKVSAAWPLKDKREEGLQGSHPAWQCLAFPAKVHFQGFQDKRVKCLAVGVLGALRPRNTCS
jgi:hypothetical protein